MAAKIRYAESDDDESVVVAGSGPYGFGTLGGANPAWMFRQAWRQVQRAGLARQADRSRPRIVRGKGGTAVWIEYPLR